jgi:hypothetical protein
MWLLVGQHAGWQTVGRQTVGKFSCDEHSQDTASCSSRRPPNVTLPFQPTNPPAIPNIQMFIIYDEMNSENDSRFVQFNVEYSSGQGEEHRVRFGYRYQSGNRFTWPQ